MPQDAFTLRYVAEELNNLFTGGKISRINQPTKDALSLLIYTRMGTVKLDVDLSAKFCRVSAGEKSEVENPKVAPNFCMLLRKHLQNAQITKVAQTGFERVIYFDLQCFSEFETADMRLYFEIMGKYSNAILTKNEIIVGALKTATLETNAKRIIFGGAKYRPPEKQDKTDPTDLGALEKAFLNKSGAATDFIAGKVAGIAYSTALDAVERYGEGITARQLYDYLNEPCSPCLVYSEGAPSDFCARPRENAKPYKNLLEAQAAYYDYATGKKRFEDEKRKLLSALNSAKKKTEKRLEQIYAKLEECKKTEDYKLKGELIVSNIYAVKRGDKTLEAVNYYDPECGKISIALDTKLTPSQNAQAYFKRYAKLKRTALNAEAQRREEEQKADYLASIENNLTLADDVRDFAEAREELIALSLLPKPQVKGKVNKVSEPFRRYGFGDFKIICGRNNAQNDRLLKALQPTDIWLHAKTYHSAHVGIICGGKEATEEALIFAAEICAHYSAAQGSDKVLVDYTQRKHVKKPSGANAGFVTYTDFKTLSVAPNAHGDKRDE